MSNLPAELLERYRKAFQKTLDDTYEEVEKNYQKEFGHGKDS